jgi:hypothetical protein
MWFLCNSSHRARVEGQVNLLMCVAVKRYIPNKQTYLNGDLATTVVTMAAVMAMATVAAVTMAAMAWVWNTDSEDARQAHIDACLASLVSILVAARREGGQLSCW